VEIISVYSYTPTQLLVVDLYNQQRTALMNAKYYARKLAFYKTISLSFDIANALATSSGFAGLAIFQKTIGKDLFSALLGLAVVISTLRPILRLADRISDSDGLGGNSSTG
jgi:hypothetical protein